MLRRTLASSRYLVVIAVLGTLAASLTLLVYEALVVAEGVIEAIRIGSVSAAKAKLLAVDLIQAVDIFLIAIAVYMISLGLYVLFIDESLPLPRWLVFRDLEDLKGPVPARSGELGRPEQPARTGGGTGADDSRADFLSLAKERPAELRRPGSHGRGDDGFTADPRWS